MDAMMMAKTIEDYIWVKKSERIVCRPFLPFEEIPFLYAYNIARSFFDNYQGEDKEEESGERRE